jgi:O-antigen ligase
VDANNGRLDLAAAGLDEFRQSPIVGQVFSTQAVAERLRDGKTLPFHDDFILFLAEGGVLGLGLLLSWMVYTEITLLRRYRELMTAGNFDRARLTRALLVMINAFFIAIPFNPVMEGVTRTATLFGVWAIAMSLGRPQRGASDLEALL